jgi:hypothetical protein
MCASHCGNRRKASSRGLMKYMSPLFFSFPPDEGNEIPLTKRGNLTNWNVRQGLKGFAEYYHMVRVCDAMYTCRSSSEESTASIFRD